MKIADIRRKAIVPLTILICHFGFGQDMFWVTKNIEQTLIKKAPRFCSEWLGYCSYELNKEEQFALKERTEIFPVNTYRLLRNDLNKALLGFALEQINAQVIIDKGLTGKGVKIGIIDGGFLNANKDPALAHLFKLENINGYKDYVTPDLEEYKGSGNLDDHHGTEVLQLTGGINTESNVQFGLATNATYYLARTDHGGYEKRIEEDYLIQALEWMHKEGVRVVNISLGYDNQFSNKKDNYKQEQMNGSTMTSRAVNIAFKEKNMLVVVAAGNSAKKPNWPIVGAPADAEGAFTVGAAKLSVWEKMDYSSLGPDFLPYIKPNISCFSTTGTSFAAPVITGLIACLMEYDSTLSATEIKTVIEKSGHFYPAGNNYMGYGVPQCDFILDQLEGKNIESPIQVLETRKQSITLKKEIKRDYVVIYHKKESWKVIERELQRPKNNKVKIKKRDNSNQTSVMIDNQVTEIHWLE